MILIEMIMAMKKSEYGVSIGNVGKCRILYGVSKVVFLRSDI